LTSASTGRTEPMLLTPDDLEGTNGAVFEDDGTVKVLFSDGSKVIMEPGKAPYCVAGEGKPNVMGTLAFVWLKEKLMRE